MEEKIYHLLQEEEETKIWKDMKKQPIKSKWKCKANWLKTHSLLQRSCWLAIMIFTTSNSSNLDLPKTQRQSSNPSAVL